MNLLIGFFTGCLVTMLISQYTIGIIEVEKIKKEVAYTEIIQELETYKKHYDRLHSESNQTDWNY